MPRINTDQTGSVGAGSDHLQLIKFWRSCAPGKGVCSGGGGILALPYYSHRGLRASMRDCGGHAVFSSLSAFSLVLFPFFPLIFLQIQTREWGALSTELEFKCLTAIFDDIRDQLVYRLHQTRSRWSWSSTSLFHLFHYRSSPAHSPDRYATSVLRRYSWLDWIALNCNALRLVYSCINSTSAYIHWLHKWTKRYQERECALSCQAAQSARAEETWGIQP